MAKWYDKVERAGMKQFNMIAATFYERHYEILNFYNNRSTNADAESFNAKIKLFRANLHGVTDKKFFSLESQSSTDIPIKFLLPPFFISWKKARTFTSSGLCCLLKFL